MADHFDLASFIRIRYPEVKHMEVTVNVNNSNGWPPYAQYSKSLDQLLPLMKHCTYKFHEVSIAPVSAAVEEREHPSEEETYRSIAEIFRSRAKAANMQEHLRIID
jgi:hypothetical protein